MKQSFFYILFIFWATSRAFAQQDTTEVFTSIRINKDPLRAKWRPELHREGNFWQLSFFDKKGIIQECISYANANLDVREGPYTRYEQGKLIERGYYSKGHKHGEWIRIKPDGQQVKTYYRYGKLEVGSERVEPHI